jgi:hypothetical protein
VARTPQRRAVRSPRRTAQAALLVPETSFSFGFLVLVKELLKNGRFEFYVTTYF